MSKQTMRPQEGKDKILQAALALFAEQGFHTTSVRQIAEAAGVSKGLTYNYFESKEKLLLAIIDQASEDMFEVAENMFSGGDYQKTLGHFLDQYFGFLQSHKTYLTFQLSLLFQPGLKDIVQASLQSRADHLLSVTEQMFHKAGVNRSDLLARRFIAELDGMALHHLSVFKHYPLGEMQDYIFQNYKDLQNDGL